MFTFGNVKVGGFFVEGGQRYRKVLHSKCWDDDEEAIRYYNAVGVRSDAPPMRLFEKDEAVDNIPRPYRSEPIPLEVIFTDQERRTQEFRENLDPDDESWEWLAGVANTLDEILEAARGGDWEAAYSKVWSLDTYDRHWISDEIYDEICGRRESES